MSGGVDASIVPFRMSVPYLPDLVHERQGAARRAEPSPPTPHPGTFTGMPVGSSP
ncbi:hypothetical protein [Microbacterium lacticum]|uniref:hypothetical protein n=1 Tax=Microbacterium lacticum TaxID=33885 RepID=UPI0028D52834|nr:hypothetical protein [Microbacterium lacticum]